MSKIARSYNALSGVKRLFTTSSKNRTHSFNLNNSIINNISNKKPYTGPLKACILDWSGTTVDRFVLAPAVAFVEVFKKYGVEITMTEAREPMGLRKDLHINQILKMPRVRNEWLKIKGSLPNKTDEINMFNDFVPMQLKCLPEYSQLLPGTRDTISVLQNEYKLRIGSTTGFTQVMVEILNNKAKEQGVNMDTYVAGDMVPNNMGFRPAPFMVYQNMCNLGVWPIESVVKVDDTVSGCQEGTNAGCWSVGINDWSNYIGVDSMEHWNTMPEKEKEERRHASKLKLLHESTAHYIIDDLTDMIDVVKHINNNLAQGKKP